MLYKVTNKPISDEVVWCDLLNYCGKQNNALLLSNGNTDDSNVLLGTLTVYSDDVSNQLLSNVAESYQTITQ